MEIGKIFFHGAFFVFLLGFLYLILNYHIFLGRRRPEKNSFIGNLFHINILNFIHDNLNQMPQFFSTEATASASARSKWLNGLTM